MRTISRRLKNDSPVQLHSITVHSQIIQHRASSTWLSAHLTRPYQCTVPVLSLSNPAALPAPRPRSAPSLVTGSMLCEARRAGGTRLNGLMELT